ncbi:MAG: hypothetical protein WCJ19_05580 [bacterium]
MSGLYKDGFRNFDIKLLTDQIIRGEVSNLSATCGPETVTIKSGNPTDEPLIVASLTPLTSMTSMPFEGAMSKVAIMSHAIAA